MCFTAEASCLNAGWRWCRSWISGQFTSVLFDLDQSLLLQLPLKPSRNLVKLCNLLKGVVIQIHCRDKCQIQDPRYCLFHGKEFRRLFWGPLFHAQCLNSGMATSYLHTHKLYLVPCSMPMPLGNSQPLQVTSKRLGKKNHPLFSFFPYSFFIGQGKHIKPQPSCHVPHHNTSRHTWRMLVFFTTEKWNYKYFLQHFQK